MVIKKVVLDVQLYFDDDGESVINIPIPEEVVFANGKIGYVNADGSPFIIADTPEELFEDLDKVAKILRNEQVTIIAKYYDPSLVQ